jgi:hypothetical protein
MFESVAVFFIVLSFVFMVTTFYPDLADGQPEWLKSLYGFVSRPAFSLLMFLIPFAALFLFG